jgi:germination protein M
MRERTMAGRLTVWTGVLSLILTACGAQVGGDATTITPTSTTLQETSTTSATISIVPATTAAPTTMAVPTTTPTTAAEPTAHGVYFLLDEMEEEAGGPFLVPVYREATGGNDPAATAMQVLLEGPTSDEISGTPSISTAVPEGTELLGVEVEAAVATVDLDGKYDDGGGSLSMFARLAQVVYTLTRLPGIDQVEFLLDGEAVTVFSSEGIELDGPQQRDDYYNLLPPIFVDSPAWGEPVTSPIQVRGLSNVFEAVSQVMLTDDDGLPLFEDTVMASCGSGCWGEWEIEIPYTVDRHQFGALIVWENSAEDGSRINVREYPVQLR